MKRIKNIEIKFINKGKLKYEDYKEKIREEQTKNLRKFSGRGEL